MGYEVVVSDVPRGTDFLRAHDQIFDIRPLGFAGDIKHPER